MNPLARLVAAVTAAVTQMDIGEVEQVGERLATDHPLPAGKLLGAAARVRLAQHDAAMDAISDVIADAGSDAPDLTDIEFDE